MWSAGDQQYSRWESIGRMPRGQRQITAALDLDWLNKRSFISVAGRQARRVIYEIYLVTRFRCT